MTAAAVGRSKWFLSDIDAEESFVSEKELLVSLSVSTDEVSSEDDVSGGFTLMESEVLDELSDGVLLMSLLEVGTPAVQ